MGLLLACNGADVTIADLDDRKLEFATWRFRRRRVAPDVVKIGDPSSPPLLPHAKYDLVIASEVLEHVRDPLLVLKALTQASKPQSFLFDSIGCDFERNAAPDHLSSAQRIGCSDGYREFYHANYTRCSINKEIEHLYRRNTPSE